MSVQFGKWNFSGEPIDCESLDRIRRTLSAHGPDGFGAYRSTGFVLEYGAFHSTAESRSEVQPLITPSGVVVAWDGRLDNRAELADRLAREIRETDADLVLAAWDEWGDRCLGQLVGDWAISVWNPLSQTLILARDPIGARPLYYRLDVEGVCWSSVLEPLVADGKGLRLCEEYIAGWLCFCPPEDLTPFLGIHAVPASFLLRFSQAGCARQRFWDFDPGLKIRYRRDSEYEEHFRSVFSSAVRRRLRSDRPVLAELSGGMDSSAIVCIADRIIAQGEAKTPRLDTVSYFDDSEPNWNERPYFQKVEEMRGRTGQHIDASSPADFASDETATAPIHLVPGSYLRSAPLVRELELLMRRKGNRVLLSGIGGDEVAGGVPTPTPELEDLLWLGDWRRLARQLKLWSLARRQPWPHLLFKTCQRFLPPQIGLFAHQRAPLWLNPGFVRRMRSPILRRSQRIRFFAPLPSFQENMAALDLLRSQLTYISLTRAPLCERRYPFLDRDLLAFLYAVPREQLVRPTQRRSLLRRALAGIVPEEILHRKRKAFVCRSPIEDVLTIWAATRPIASELKHSSQGIIDSPALGRAVESLASGREIPAPGLMRAIELQLWLKEMSDRGVLPNGIETSSARQVTWRTIREQSSAS